MVALDTPRSGIRPLCAWCRYRGPRHKPDLRSSGHLPRGTTGARIEFVADPSRALLSDFSRWHHVLNYWYLPASRADERRFENELKAQGLDFFAMKPLPNPVFDRRIRASWERIFDLDLTVQGIADRPADRSIQATVWALPREAVREVVWFTAR